MILKRMPHMDARLSKNESEAISTVVRVLNNLVATMNDENIYQLNAKNGGKWEETDLVSLRKELLELQSLESVEIDTDEDEDNTDNEQHGWERQRV